MEPRGALSAARGFMEGYSFMDRAHHRDQQEARAEETQDWRRQQHQWKKDEYQNLEDRRVVAAMMEGAKTGQFNPKIVDEYERRFHVDLSNYLDPQFGDSLNQLEGVVKGDNKLRAPQTVKAFNQVFGPEMRRNVGEERNGKKIVDKRAVGIYPVDGGRLAVDLEVDEQDAQGNRSTRNAPLTVNRSALDEEVKAVPVDAVVDKLTGHKLMYNTVQSSPELQSMLRQRMARLGGEVPEAKASWSKPFKHPSLGWVQRDGEGQLHQLDSGKGNSKLPADAQMANWMVQNKIAKDLDEAWNRVRESRTDPAKFVSDFVEQELEVQKAAGLYPGDEGYRSTEELRKRAIQVLNTIRRQTRGGSDTADPGAGRDDNAGGGNTVAPGSATRNEDGSYSGKVDRSRPKSLEVIDKKTEVPGGKSKAEEKSADRTAEDIRADYQAGKVTRDEALAELRKMGFE